MPICVADIAANPLPSAAHWIGGSLESKALQNYEVEMSVCTYCAPALVCDVVYKIDELLPHSVRGVFEVPER